MLCNVRPSPDDRAWREMPVFDGGRAMPLGRERGFTDYEHMLLIGWIRAQTVLLRGIALPALPPM